MTIHSTASVRKRKVEKIALRRKICVDKPLALGLMCVQTKVMTKRRNSNVAGFTKGKMKTLPVLQAASDQNVLFALEALQKRGDFKEKLPSYGLIGAEIVKMRRPALDGKQISRSIKRLRRYGYILSRDELRLPERAEVAS